MRDQRDDYSDRRADHRTDQRADHRTEHRADHVANREHGVANPGRREQYDSVYQDMDERRGSRYEARYDSHYDEGEDPVACLLYTSPSPRDLSTSRMPSSA